jgi:hypothetical protein
VRIRNSEIRDFAMFLLDEKLSGKKSRMRTRFIKLLDERLKQIDEERLALLKEFAELDENGNVKTREDGTAIMSDENMAKFQVEFAELMNEEFVIDETEERREMLLTIKDIVLNTEKEFSGQSAFQYDRWCEIVEAIEYGAYGGANQ